MSETTDNGLPEGGAGGDANSVGSEGQPAVQNSENPERWLKHMPANLGVQSETAGRFFNAMHGAGHNQIDAYAALGYFRENETRIPALSPEQALDDLKAAGMSESGARHAMGIYHQNAKAFAEVTTRREAVIARLEAIEKIQNNDRRRFYAENLSQERRELLGALDHLIWG